jgi:hypothetical protein
MIVVGVTDRPQFWPSGGARWDVSFHLPHSIDAVGRRRIDHESQATRGRLQCGLRGI